MWWQVALAAYQTYQQGQDKKTGAMMGGGGAPNRFGETQTNSWLDGSGWTVATSGSSAKGGDRDQSSGVPVAPGDLDNSKIALIGGALLIGFIAWRVTSK
jgi:hypothetical protein